MGSLKDTYDILKDMQKEGVFRRLFNFIFPSFYNIDSIFVAAFNTQNMSFKKNGSYTKKYYVDPFLISKDVNAKKLINNKINYFSKKIYINKLIDISTIKSFNDDNVLFAKLYALDKYVSQKQAKKIIHKFTDNNQALSVNEYKKFRGIL